jgi:hypothetical protein
MKKDFGEELEIRFEEAGTSSPCYFNDGCCCYDNGITAIELDKGMIRLVKWNRDESDKNIYQEEKLDALLNSIKSFQ